MLDAKDSKILGELELNARMSFSELAKKVRLSKQVVQYRVRQLEEKNLIEGYNALVDLPKLNQTIYVIYFRLIRMSSAEEYTWLEEISKIKQVMTIGKNSGHWDLTIAVKCKNNQELDKTVLSIIENKSEKIKEKLITTEIESSYISTKIIFNTKSQEVTTSNDSNNLSLDEKDQEILKILSNNCKTSLLEIAKEVDMSPNGVKNKIKKMEQKGIIIGYKTKINFEKLGYMHFRVFLHVNDYSKKLYSKIKEFLKQTGTVESVSHYLGYADIDFRCYAKNIVELQKLITQVKEEFLEQIIEVNSIPIYNWSKIQYY